MKIAVTGSSGFIGSHLVPRLKKEGHELTEISRSKGIDITDWDSVKDLEACEVIVHLAAKTFVPDSFDNPAEFYKVNYTATLHALELARKWKARVIYMSSYFYGPPQYLPVDEKHPLNPHNPYAQSKMQSEQLCEAYSRDFGVPCIAFRLFNIYGPGQTGNFLIPEILEKIKQGGVITLKDPRPKRDFIHVDDVVEAVHRAIVLKTNGFKEINLGTGKSISVQQLTDAIKSNSAQEITVRFTNEYRKNEVLDSVCCTEKLFDCLGQWQMETIEAGIKTIFDSNN